MFLVLGVAFFLLSAVFKYLLFYFGTTIYTLKTSLIVGIGIFMVVILIPTYINYFRSRFFIPWCWIGGALLLLTGVNYLQMVIETRFLGPILVVPTELVRTFTYGLLAIGFFSYYRAHRRIVFPVHTYPDQETMSEKEKLELVFVYFAESLFSLYSAIYGKDNERGLQKKWNHYVASEKETLFLKEGKLSGVAIETDLLSQSKRLKKYLEQICKMLAHYCGNIFVNNLLKKLAHQLYWTEKDVADNYLFRSSSFGEELLSTEEEKEISLEVLLRDVPLFLNLSQKEKADLIKRFKRKAFRPGKKIIREGKKGDEFYLIAYGECDVLKKCGFKNVSSAHLRQGDFFGEKALLEDTPRTATLLAKTKVVTYSLNKADFLAILRKSFGFLPKFERYLERVDFLSPIPIFTLFSKVQLSYLASQMKEEKFKSGTAIFQQDDEAEDFYLIQEGEVDVFIKAEGEVVDKAIARLGKGECFGEIALLKEGKRTATIRVVTETTCLKVSKKAFDYLFKDCSYNRHKLERLIQRREEDLKKKLL